MLNNANNNSFQIRHKGFFELLSKSSLLLLFYIISGIALIMSIASIWLFYYYTSLCNNNKGLSKEIETLTYNKITKQNSSDLLALQNIEIRKYEQNQTDIISKFNTDIKELNILIENISNDNKNNSNLNHKDIILSSSIFKSNEEIEMIEKAAKGTINKLCYSSTIMSFIPKIARENCKYEQYTIALYKNEHNSRFGGYSSTKWSDDNACYMSDNNAFLFSLTNLLVFPVIANEIAIHNHNEYFPSFGTNDLECHYSKCKSSFPTNYGNMNIQHSNFVEGFEFEINTLEIYSITPIIN